MITEGEPTKVGNFKQCSISLVTLEVRFALSGSFRALNDFIDL